MKYFFLLLALIASGLASAAPSDQETSPVTISGAKERIVLPDQHHKMWPADYYDYMRDYSLSNGMTLSVFGKGTKMYAALNDQPWHEIVATAPDTFVALDRKLKMTINLLGSDDARGELYMMVPVQRLSHSHTAGERLVSVAFH